MSEHRCIGDGCPVCESRIDGVEDRRGEPDDTAWQAAQDAYERQLDRQGGSL